MVSSGTKKNDTSHNVNTDEKVPFWISYRFLLAVLGCLGFINSCTIRVNMFVAVVCMVNHTAVMSVTPVSSSLYSEDNSTLPPPNIVDTCPKELAVANETRGKADMGTFVWSKKIQGLVLGSFFWGYLITQVIGGWLATKFGGKRIFGYGMIIAAIASLASPIAASVSYIFLIVLRVIIGMTTGTTFPSMHTIWGNWAPPLERTKLLAFTYAGNFLGTVIAFPVSALLCKYGFGDGWSSVFYVFGASSFIWAVIWLLVVTDTPIEHKRITKLERDYIVNSRKGEAHVGKQKVNVPWLKILTSMPVHAIIVSNITSDWGLYTLLTGIPTYMKEVLKFNIESNGLASALPYVVLWILMNVSANIADLIRKKHILNTTWTRRIFDATGKLIPAGLLIGLGYMNCNHPYIAVGLLTLAVSLTGLQYSGFIVNHVDIAPPVAGILFGISNSLGAITGFISPLVTAALTPTGAQAEWQIVFYISAAVYLFGAIFYLVFASGEEQDWVRYCYEPSDQPKIDEVAIEPLMSDTKQV